MVPQARRLRLAGPADLARALSTCGRPDEAGRWAADPCLAYLRLDHLTESLAAALSGESAAYAVRVAASSSEALLGGSSGALAALGRRLRTLGHELGAEWEEAALEPPAGSPPPLRLGPWTLPFGLKTYVMGIVNLTPDSFSEEAGRVPAAEESVTRVHAAVAEGADLIDLGAESSESREHGATGADEELRRLLPVLERLSGLPVPLSVDTRQPRVAREALAHGVTLINDVDALRDPEMARVAAESGAGVIVMHNQAQARYQSVMGDVAAFLAAAVRRAVDAGVAETQVVVDAGFGFAKTVYHDLEQLRRLAELRSLGRPILHAPSRKRTIGRVLDFPETIPERLPGTAAAVALGVAAGADMVRVHDLPAMARVARMADAAVRGAYSGEP